MYPWQVSSRRSRSPYSFTPIERFWAAAAIVLLVVGVFGLVRDRSKAKEDRPVVGGTYSEGVIADSPTKVERIVARMTNIGITYRDADGSIQPALAQSWEITNENKTYTFRLRDGVSAEGLLATIQSSKTNWSGISVSAPDSQTLQFTLQEPLSLFLATTTDPLFPYGPYEVVKRDKQEIILRARDSFVLGAPYLQKISVKQYASQDELLKAAQDGEIDGSADFAQAPERGFQEHSIELPRYHILFVNLTKPHFKKVEDRLRVMNRLDGNPVTYTLLTSQGGIASDLADAFVRDAATKKITLTTVKKNGMTLQKEDLPKREYDLLLYGINYGLDRDYYPFWHSSQVTATGLNLAGAKDKELDKMLESARREQDGLKRRELNNQIEAYLIAQGYQQVLQQEKTVFWMSKEIKGVEYGTIDEANDRFNLVWQWYIKTKKVPIK